MSEEEELRERLEDVGVGGGSSVALNRREISGKLNATWARAAQITKPAETVESLLDRNDQVRRRKGLPTRAEEKTMGAPKESAVVTMVVTCSNCNERRAMPDTTLCAPCAKKWLDENAEPESASIDDKREKAQAEVKDFLADARKLALFHSDEEGTLGDIARRMVRFMDESK